MNVEKIKVEGLTFKESLGLYLLYKQLKTDFNSLYEGYNSFDKIELLEKLEQRGYIACSAPIIFTKKTKESFKEESFGKPLRQLTSLLAPKVDWIKEYRMLFAGKRPKAMGSEAQCTSRMDRFTLNYPQYDKDTIINATKYYLEIEKDNNMYKYIKQADNFIYSKKGGEPEESRLLQMIEEYLILEERKDKNKDSTGWIHGNRIG